MLAAVPALIAIAVKTTLSQPGADAPDFFRSITQNGLFVALAALTIELGLFLPLAVAVVAGDSVAGEANIGTLRYLLTVPVTRGRLLAVKYAAIVVGAFVATFVVAAVGIVMGLVLFGGGSMTTLSGTQISFAAGLLRVLAAAVYLSCGLAALGRRRAVLLDPDRAADRRHDDDRGVQHDVVHPRLDPAGVLAAPLPDHPPLARLR